MLKMLFMMMVMLMMIMRVMMMMMMVLIMMMIEMMIVILMMIIILVQENAMCSVECKVWPGSLTPGSAREKVRSDWSSPARNLRGRVSLHPDPAS